MYIDLNAMASLSLQNFESPEIKFSLDLESHGNLSSIEDAEHNCEYATELALMADSLFPARGYSPLTYKDLTALAIAISPERDFDIWDQIINQLGYYPQQYPVLDEMVNGVFNYFRDHVRPTLVFRDATESEQAILEILRSEANAVFNEYSDVDQRIEHMTLRVYEVGKAHYGTEKKDLLGFFRMFYEVMLGQESGPRLPIFICYCGQERFNQIIDGKIRG